MTSSVTVFTFFPNRLCKQSDGLTNPFRRENFYLFPIGKKVPVNPIILRDGGGYLQGTIWQDANLFPVKLIVDPIGYSRRKAKAQEDERRRSTVILDGGRGEWNVEGATGGGQVQYS